MIYTDPPSPAAGHQMLQMPVDSTQPRRLSPGLRPGPYDKARAAQWDDRNKRREIDLEHHRWVLLQGHLLTYQCISESGKIRDFQGCQEFGFVCYNILKKS